MYMVCRAVAPVSVPGDCTLHRVNVSLADPAQVETSWCAGYDYPKTVPVLQTLSRKPPPELGRSLAKGPSAVTEPLQRP